jgi:hypothetical protein
MRLFVVGDIAGQEDVRAKPSALCPAIFSPVCPSPALSIKPMEVESLWLKLKSQLAKVVWTDRPKVDKNRKFFCTC